VWVYGCVWLCTRVCACVCMDEWLCVSVCMTGDMRLCAWMAVCLFQGFHVPMWVFVYVVIAFVNLQTPREWETALVFHNRTPLIIGLFGGKWPTKIRHPMGLGHPVVWIPCIPQSYTLIIWDCVGAVTRRWPPRHILMALLRKTATHCRASLRGNDLQR